MHRGWNRLVLVLGLIALIAVAGGVGAGAKKKEEFGEKKGAPKNIDGKTILDVKGELTEKDERDPNEKDCYCKNYKIKMKAGKKYQIDLRSTEFDAFLSLRDMDGAKLAENDDVAKDNLDSRIVFTATADGEYKICASTREKKETGKFTLAVIEGAGDKPTQLKLEVTKGGSSATVNGELTSTDANDKDGKRFKVYIVELQEGKRYSIHMKGAAELDAHVRLDDAAGKLVRDDEFGERGESEVRYTPDKTATFRIIATTEKGDATGKFTLTVTQHNPPVVAGATLTFQKGKPTIAQGTIAAADPKDDKGRHFKTYAFDAVAGKSYKFSLAGLGGFAPLLHLQDGNGAAIKEEDSGDEKVSHLAFTAKQSDTFKLVALAYKSGQTGNYTLTAAEEGKASPPVVLGKAEPLVIPAGKSVTVNGKLTAADPKDDQGKHFKVYSFTAQPGRTYRIELFGQGGLDPEARLENATGTPVAKEDFGDGKVSRLKFAAVKAGTYRIVASAYKPGVTGEYALSVTNAETRPADVVAMPAFQKLTVAEIVGKLTDDDDVDGAGNRYKVYTFKAQPDKLYRVEMNGRTFDAKLRLVDEMGNKLKDEDFSNGRFSQLFVPPGKGGVHRIVASSAKAKEMGAFSLTITEVVARQPEVEAITFERVSRLNGKITVQDGIDGQGKFFKSYTLKTQPGMYYRCEMVGAGFNAMLRLEDEKGSIVKEDTVDDKVARLVYKATNAASLRLIVTTFKAGQIGEYNLFIVESDKNVPEPKAPKDGPKKADGPKKGQGTNVEPGKQPTGTPFKLDNGKDSFDDALTANDGPDPQKKHFKAFPFKAEKGTTYRFSMTGKGGLDPMVRVDDTNGKTLKSEDFGDGKISQVFFTAPQTGPYRVVASTYKADMTGDFSLRSEVVEVKLAKAEPLKFDMGKAVANAKLTEADGVLVAGNKFYKEYTFQGTAGKSYKIDLHSKDFDAFLYLKDSAGKTLAQNDDNGEPNSLDSRIIWKADKASTLHIVATSLGGGSTGKFLLTVGEPSAAETLMARAGDFQDAPPAERKQFVADLKKHLADQGGKLNQNDAALAMRVGIDLESAADKQLAAETYASFGKLLAASTDANVARQGKVLTGAGKRLGLVGNTMQLKGATIDGKEFDLAKLKGKVVLVDFWASWCGPCKAELPRVKKLYEKYHAQGFEVIGISFDNAKADLTNFLAKEKLPWTSIFEGANDLGDDYGIFGIPLAILVGRDCRVISLEARGPDLDRLLEEQFSKK